jgi:hypothetical protein
MGLYNMLHGTNPASGLLLRLAGFTNIHDVGRFRDAYVTLEDGEALIAVYTRNGGGNRECGCEMDPKWGTAECKHHTEEYDTPETVELKRDEEIPEGYTFANTTIGDKRLYRTGRVVKATRYICEEPSSPACACTGCIITYRLPALENYVCDEDDDFDPTYCTIYFTPPEEAVEALRLFALPAEDRPDAAWRDLIENLERPLEEIPEDGTKGQRIARGLLASLAQKREEGNAMSSDADGAADG